MTTVAGWVSICPYTELLPERGVAALVDGGQVAVFRTYDGTVHALDNRDPFTGVHVMSRGLVGTRGSAPVVISPLHKQAFDLRTGDCLDEPGASLRVYPVRINAGVVQVSTGDSGKAL